MFFGGKRVVDGVFIKKGWWVLGKGWWVVGGL